MSYRNECKYGDSCGFDFCVPEYCKDFEPAQMTNADRIRAMDDEELAKIIMCPYDNDHNSCVPGSNCLDCCLKWLQQPYEEGTVCST